ncbi:MAG: hypothetical protein Q9191_001640 [Dirinaria sp. TL-2023a]
MVKSLDGLISFLLDEVSFCGQEGARPSDFVEYVNNYYGHSSEGAEATTVTPLDNVSASTSFAVDRPFLEQVWKWLVQHPEIRVGKNGEGNKLSLSQVEASYQKAPWDSHPGNDLQRINDGTQHELVLENPAAQSAQSAPINTSDQKQASQKQIKKSAVLAASSSEHRLYTTKARVWQAIAGHAPDDSKIQPAQFQCLSIISSRRSQGILQSELVKVSGQDKRSVPKRTDLLAAGGYIHKRPVLAKGMKTSILYAKRFAPSAGPLLPAAVSSKCSSGESQPGEAMFIDYRTVYDAILDILREPRIVTIVDLKERLVGTDHRRLYRVLTYSQNGLQITPSKSMWKSMTGRMAQIGLTKKVHARAHYEERAPGRRMVCLKLLRDPVERDYETLMATNVIESTVDDGAIAQNSEAESVKNSDAAEKIGIHSANDFGEPPSQQLGEGASMAPQWRSEQDVNHLLFDTVNASGTQGISTKVMLVLTYFKVLADYLPGPSASYLWR